MFKQRRFVTSSIAFCFAATAVFAQALMDDNISTRYRHPMHVPLLSSAKNDYGSRYDPLTGNVVLTSERQGFASVYWISESSILRDTNNGEVELSPGTFNVNGFQRAFASFSSSGEAVGAAYVMREQRSYMGVVSILRDGGMLNCGLPIEKLNGSFFVSHPTISADGLRIVVASDRAGTPTGLDLFISERMSGGEWSEPSALSPLVNSAGNEMSPVFVGNDSLFFASDGYGGKGGLDVFLTVFQDGAWQEPVPLDWLNSEFDDSDACMLSNGAIMFSSNRPGGLGGLDIYIVHPQ